MTVYYNEIDPKAAAWLRELIKRGLIADGDVDETDIRDVDPARLGGYTQCHFFAGIGGWSLGLRLAGWPDDRPVWTGSCPCQPFSAAGRRAGTADERHLWPHWHHLISQCQPAIVFGEQVASKDGLGWLDLVHADMEATGYAFGAADLCAAGIGAPHIRQRLWFVGERLADAGRTRGVWRQDASGFDDVETRQRNEGAVDDQPCGSAGRLADAQLDEQRSGRGARSEDQSRHEPRTESSGRGEVGGMADAMPAGRAEGRAIAGYGSPAGDGICGGMANTERPRPTNGQWRDADWLFCRDGKWRPVEPGTFPLAHGLSARVGRLRGYGNAIVPQVAATFIRSVME
jgi:DNA (cytosine-5)-methyltransferase 1